MERARLDLRSMRWAVESGFARQAHDNIVLEALGLLLVARLLTLLLSALNPFGLAILLALHKAIVANLLLDFQISL